jgi:hypothetical protein
VRLDAALALGATVGHARRTFQGSRLGVPLSALWLSVALAATNLAPALVLAPTFESRPLAPALLILADEPGAGLGRASALAVAALTLNLTALGLAARSRPGRLGDWFRG